MSMGISTVECKMTNMSEDRTEKLASDVEAKKSSLSETSFARRVVSCLLFVLPIVVLGVIADQWTKHAVEDELMVGEIIPIIDNFFNLTLTFNKGAAFGMFANLPDGTRQLVLWSVSLAAVAAIFYFLFFEYYSHRLGKFSLGCILSGAVGNGIDRAMRGEVVDFLDFYIGAYHWPAFNVADSLITVGATILIFLTLFSKENTISE